MKKSIFIFFVSVIIALLINNVVFSQRNEWVNQVIIANGGRFESAPNPTDYVTVQRYDPNTQQTTLFGTIYTQSVQHVMIKDNFAYVAAQDSIIKYNIDSYQRVAAIRDSGLSKLFVFNNRLIVTKQFPIKRFFVEILDANDLSLISRVQNISGDCGEAIYAGDSLYVAVNGGFQGTEGKLAVINPSNWALTREINFGPLAKGIWNLYNYNALIYAICRTPSGSTDIANITLFDYYVNAVANIPLAVTVGEGYGYKDSLLYMNINNGIGSFNLLSWQIEDTTLFPDPGSANRVVISSSAVDYVNGLLYINVGNMFTYGRGIIANITGDSIGNYPTGINADGIAIDYRTPVGLNSKSGTTEFLLFPNPVSAELIIETKEQCQVKDIILSDPTGKSYSVRFTTSNNLFHVDCSNLSKGLYFVTLKTDTGVTTKKFIKE